MPLSSYSTTYHNSNKFPKCRLPASMQTSHLDETCLRYETNLLKNVEFFGIEDYGYTLYFCDHKTNEINNKIHIIQLKVSWLIRFNLLTYSMKQSPS